MKWHWTMWTDVKDILQWIAFKGEENLFQNIVRIIVSIGDVKKELWITSWAPINYIFKKIAYKPQTKHGKKLSHKTKSKFNFIKILKNQKSFKTKFSDLRTNFKISSIKGLWLCFVMRQIWIFLLRELLVFFWNVNVFCFAIQLKVNYIWNWILTLKFCVWIFLQISNSQLYFEVEMNQRLEIW